MLFAQPVAAQKRVALVLGNSAYQSVPPLPNPAHDAEAIGHLFQSSGFNFVQVHRDLALGEMRRVIRDFSDQTRDADIAVIYFAGHGIEVGGTNYLVPVDAVLKKDIDVEDETVSLDRLLQVMESAKRLRLVILDACRDNPFAKSMARTLARRSVGRGLARVEPETADTLIAFAAKAGMYAIDGDGTNSPFTISLLKNLVTPGLDVRLALGRVRDEVLAATNHEQEPFVYGSLGGGVVSLAPESVVADRASDLAPKLVSILEKTGVRSAKDAGTNYSRSGMHRSLAIAPKAKGPWWTFEWPSREIAEEKVLEKCLQFYDEPCAIIATDESLSTPRSDGVWFTQDAPRVRYAGTFNPERIPALRHQALSRPEIAGYAELPSPKAAAFHATEIFAVVSGSASQRAAEEQALKECNANPIRNRSGGPCYLYAVENRVVLPLRLTAPLTPAPASTPAGLAQTPQASNQSSITTTLESTLIAEMERIAPAMPEKVRQREGSLYASSGNNKAMAMHPPYDSWRTALWPTEALAYKNTLEACEMRHGEPCILLAVNDRLEQRPASEEWRRIPSPRVHYSGLFEPEQIPTLKDEDRTRLDVVDYRSVSGNKAAALHPWGRIFIVTGTKTQFAAEVKALSDCNEDPTRNGRDGPCYLYAVGNQVVLTRRSRFPLSAKE